MESSAPALEGRGSKGGANMGTPEWEDYAASQAEAYLLRVRDRRRTQDALMRERLDALEMLDGIKAVRYDGAGGGGCNDPDGAMMAAIESLDGCVRRIQANVNEFNALYTSCRDSLQRMEDPTLRGLLDSYYVRAKTWQAVADELHYSIAEVYRLRPRALVAFYYVMPHRYREPVQPAL